MIEVSARLTRGSVYLAGEIIECILTFKNPGASPSARAQSNKYVDCLIIPCCTLIHDERYMSVSPMSLSQPFVNNNECY